MIRLYRLQQHIGITRAEATTLLTLAGLFLLGLGVRAVQQHPALPPLAAEATASPMAVNRALAASAVVPPGAGAPLAQAAIGSDATAEAPAVRTAERRPKANRPIPRLNLNTATAAQLELLPRVGPKMAERIVAYRSTHGGFRKVQDLLAVKGIGEKTLALLEPHVFVE